MTEPVVRRLGLRVVGDGLMLVDEGPRWRVTLDTGLLRAPPTVLVEATARDVVRFEAALDERSTDADVGRALDEAREACARALEGGYRD